jgi:hypothetical protein
MTARLKTTPLSSPLSQASRHSLNPEASAKQALDTQAYRAAALSSDWTSWLAKLAIAPAE